LKFTMNTQLAETSLEKLEIICARPLDPLFWASSRTGVTSSWYGHVPFAHWLISEVKPATLVELGTHNGVSYSAFCEAVRLGRLGTRCWAVDTWRGDEQSGSYGEDVYLDFRRFHDERFSAFSELLRCTFDEGLAFFADGSVDLLHIDGLHTYSAVKHDYQAWLPKLSDSAVILFHDTNVRANGFGVWRLWEELTVQFPSFEFLHGHGLGVLAIGRTAPPSVVALCAIEDEGIIQTLRQRFAFLGERWIALDERIKLEQLQHGSIDICDAQIESLRSRLEASERLVLEQSRTAEAELRKQAAKLAVEQQLRARAAQRSAQARADAVNATFLAVNAGSQIMRKRAQWPNGASRAVYISGEPKAPGNFYRVVRYVETMRALGFAASWLPQEEICQHLEEIGNADLVVFWRVPWSDDVKTAIELNRRAGGRLAFDIDDFLIDPAFARVEIIDAIRTSSLSEEDWKKQFERWQTTMSNVDVCIVPTEELAAQVRRFRLPALVLPNGFDYRTYELSRLAVGHWKQKKDDELIRIGYASGTKTHQRDFAVAAAAISRVLRERNQCRLVLFRDSDLNVPTLELTEYEGFDDLQSQIEWREYVPITSLPEELARFDISIAPLEIPNPFCECKSELKFFESALVDVPTIASSTGPFRRAIQNGSTGFLAENREDWYRMLLQLVDDHELRRQIAREAHYECLAKFGDLRRINDTLSALPKLLGNERFASHMFCPPRQEASLKRAAVSRGTSKTIFESDQLKSSNLSAILVWSASSANLDEAIGNCRMQSPEPLDLIVVSVDLAPSALENAVSQLKMNQTHFNRIKMLVIAGGEDPRNVGIDSAETPFVLVFGDSAPLPGCAQQCISAMKDTGAAAAYPRWKKANNQAGHEPNCALDQTMLIDLATVSSVTVLRKEAWVAVRGYRVLPAPLQDIDFWCHLVELGMWCTAVGDTALEQAQSSQEQRAATPDSLDQAFREVRSSFSWLKIVPPGRPTDRESAFNQRSGPRSEELS
jgi:glycosyltransferase involved in cell wall biosynthesis